MQMLVATLFLVLTVPFMTGCKGNPAQAEPGRPDSADQRPQNEPWLGLVGDSGITGAVTMKDINPNLGGMLNLARRFVEADRPQSRAQAENSPFATNVLNADGALPPLRRVLYSTEEITAAKEAGKEDDLSMEGRGSLALDTPEYSFGYLVGRAMDFSPEQIVLVAQDGKRTGNLPEQMRRFSEVSEKLPSHIIVSFTANDICGKEMEEPVDKFRTDFKGVLTDAWKKTMEKETPHESGTQVFVVAPIEITQGITNNDLLEQEIDFEGLGTRTCNQVRRGEPQDNELGKLIDSRLTGMCRGILSIEPNETEKIEKVQALQKTQIEVWKEVLAELPKKDGWSFEFIEETHQVRFQRGDLANECFHPGPGAHSRLADTLFARLKQVSR